MVSESNFIVRMSGRKADCWYIDYAGVYKAVEIAKVSGMEASVVKEIYIKMGVHMMRPRMFITFRILIRQRRLYRTS
jgi:hypothetical protein